MNDPSEWQILFYRTADGKSPVRDPMTDKEQIHEDTLEEARDYQEWRDALLADPRTRALYDEISAQKELWLQLVEARQCAGLTQKQVAERMGVSQAQVSRIEKAGYDAYTLTTLRRYLAALGEGFALEVRVHVPEALRRKADEDRDDALRAAPPR